MGNRKLPEPTLADVPDSIAPWKMLDEEEIAGATAGLRPQHPHGIAFARRSSDGAVACFDKGPDGAGKAVLVLPRDGRSNAPPLARYPGFTAWFDDALAEAQTEQP